MMQDLFNEIVRPNHIRETGLSRENLISKGGEVTEPVKSGTFLIPGVKDL